MNRSFILGGALALGIGIMAGGAALEPPARAQEAAAWLPSFDAARAAARQAGKPIFLVFR